MELKLKDFDLTREPNGVLAAKIKLISISYLGTIELENLAIALIEKYYEIQLKLDS